MGFDFAEHQGWLERYISIWRKVEEQIFNTLTKNPVNKDRFVNAKLKMWDNNITTDFHGACIPQNTRCEATAILQINSVYKQGTNYYPQVYVQECKYKEIPQKYHQALLSDSEDEEWGAV